MAVIATAGHVDHGKSTLVRLLTGMEPDRWAEEKRRGLTIDLGYAWTDIDGRRVSLVDVPGHEHFTGNMLAGLGPVAGVMFVVAADDGWCAQSQEHARAISALGIEHVLLVVTRSDLAMPSAAMEEASGRLRDLGVPVRESVAVSGHTGVGVPDVRKALGRLAAASLQTDLQAPLRLWVDRAFSIRGVGTVVTATLSSGTVTLEDELMLGDRTVRVRGLQTCGEQVDSLTAPARIAVNLRGVPLADVARGDVLLDPRAARRVTTVDVTPRLPPGAALERLPREALLHVGTSAMPVRTQRRQDGAVRLQLATPLPLRRGDRAVLRDPGRHEVLAGVEVVTLDPPSRGQRRRRPTPAYRPGLARANRPEAASHAVDGGSTGGGRTGGGSTEAAEAAYPLDVLPPGLLALRAWLAEHPLHSPTRDQLEAWSLTPRALAEAEGRGELVRVAGLVLHPDAPSRVESTARGLGRPFRPGDVAAALGTSRRVVVALLERLDTALVTRRLPDGTRVVR